MSPRRLVRALVSREGDALRVGHVRHSLSERRVLILGAGKGAPAIAQELEALLGGALDEGVVVTRTGYALPTERVRMMEGGHPLPDEAGARAAQALAALAGTAREGDLVLCAFTGGGSALLSLPPPGVALEDLRGLNELMLRSGMPIEDMNTVRRHVGVLGGGGLARRLGRASVVTLVLSDVVGDRAETIASGPTVPDPTTYAQARCALVRHALWMRVPPTVRVHITRGEAGLEPETLKPCEADVAPPSVFLLGSYRTALAAAAEEGARRGWQVRVMDDPLEGEAREAGRRLALAARGLPDGHLLLAGGETTVEVRGPGRGGRNQELALAAALELDGTRDIEMVALATDGSDGPTDAAGAIVDGHTAARAKAERGDPVSALRANDSYASLRAAGDLLVTGPTGTNVADLAFVFRGRPDQGGPP